MNNLKSLLDQLKDKRAESNIPVEEADPRVRAGVEAMVRNAKVDVEKLEAAYRDSVMSNVVVIAVSGKFSKEFAEQSAKLKTVSLDYLGALKEILTELVSKHVGPVYTSTAHFHLLDILSRFRIKNNMVQLSAPTINNYSDGIYETPLEQALLKMFEKNYGPSLYSVISKIEIGKAALAKEFSGKYLPVVLYNYTGSVNTEFLPQPIVTIQADKPMTEKEVLASLTQVKELVSPSKPKKPKATGTESLTQSNETTDEVETNEAEQAQENA